MFKTHKDMKKLTLQIEKANFQAILKGEQDVETRFIYPSNAKKYVHFVADGVTYATEAEIPEEAKDIECVPNKYDVLYLINGRRKDAPRLLVEVKDAEFVILEDENGEEYYYEENGNEYLVCQVWYHLGKVLETENV